MSRKEEKKKGTSRKEKKNKRGNMPSTKRKRKKKGNVQERKEKKKGKEEEERGNVPSKKKKKGRKELDMGIFVYYATLFSSFNFLLILGRKLFGRSKEKILGSHNLFFFLLTQPNTLQKILIFIFALKFYIYPILCLNKHTLIHTNYLTFLPQPNGQG